MRNHIVRPASLSVLVVLCSFGFVAPAGAILIVNPDGSGDYPTIQAAVDAAAASDVIQLGPGVFTGPGNRDILVTGKVLTIRGGGDDPTLWVIDAGGATESPHGIFRVVGAATMRRSTASRSPAAGSRLRTAVGPLVRGRRARVARALRDPR